MAAYAANAASIGCASGGLAFAAENETGIGSDRDCLGSRWLSESLGREIASLGQAVESLSDDESPVIRGYPRHLLAITQASL